MPRGDGRLSHDHHLGEKGPQDACGVFGVWTGSSTENEEVAKLTYFGLYALQHRGQESAGIAVSNGSQILVYKDMGLVSQVFDEGHLGALRGHLAIGHTRYSTTGASVWENAQPTFRSTANGSIALGHNGNLTNIRDLLTLVEKREAESGMLPYDEGAPHRRPDRAATTDTEVVTALLASYPDRSLEAAALEVLPRLRGAFSLVWMDEGTLYAARDPQG
ncbi:MAG: amidophosphoribosyltransferase, partial [Actinomycetota bacterium]|nr:amidophosphoribosyltransferase [Actinomycetota bacterium]